MWVNTLLKTNIDPDVLAPLEECEILYQPVVFRVRIVFQGVFHTWMVKSWGLGPVLMKSCS